MPEEKSATKQYIGTLKSQIQSILFDGLNDNNRERFFASKSRDYLKEDYYEIRPSDNDFIKSSKITLNVLTSIEKLIESPANTVWATNLVNDLYNKIEFEKFFTVIKSALKTLHDQAPAAFKIVLNNVQAKLKENPEGAEFLSNVTVGLYQEARQGVQNRGEAESDIIGSLKSGIFALQQIANPVPANKLASPVSVESNEEANKIFRKLHDKLLEAVAKTYGEDTKNSFMKNDKSRYVILQNDSDTIKNIKGLLNASNSLANTQAIINSSNQAGLLNIITGVISNLKTIYASYKNLMSDKNSMALAGALNEIIGSTLKDFNTLMMQIASYADSSEINLGLRQGYIFKQLKPAFDAHQDLMKAAKVQVEPERRYPYFAERIKALEAEKVAKETTQEDVESKMLKLEQIKEIFKRRGNESLNKYTSVELSRIKINIDLLNLSEKDKEQYVNDLKAALKQAPKRSLNQQPDNSYWSQVNNMVGSAINYAGLSLHSFVVEQADTQLEILKGKRDLLKNQNEDIDAAVSSLKSEQALKAKISQTKVVSLSAENIESANAVKEKPVNATKSGIIRSFFSAIASFFTETVGKLFNELGSKSEDEIVSDQVTSIYSDPRLNIKNPVSPAAGGTFEKENTLKDFDDEDKNADQKKSLQQFAQVVETKSETPKQPAQENALSFPTAPTCRK